jgi:signal transduction histidine kinase
LINTTKKLGINNIVILIVALFTTVILLGVSYYKTNRSRKEVTISNRLTSKVLSVQNIILEAESSQRGYLLTENQLYLGPYKTAEKKYKQLYKELIEENRNEYEVAINPVKIKKLDSIISLKFLELDKTIRLSESGNNETSLLIVESDLGLFYMRDIRIITSDIIKSLNTRYIIRKDSYHTWNYISICLLSLSFIIILISLISLLTKIKPVLSDLVKTKRSLESSNAQLNKYVENLRIANKEKDRAMLKNRLLIDSLKVKNEQLDHFAYVASHDLQEPLRTVSNYVEIFEEDYEDKLDDDARMYFGFIDGALDRMRKLISGLLNFSRLGTSGEKEKINLNDCLNEIKANFQATIEEEDIVIHAESLPVVEAYRVEITQLFQNIISNAIKFRKKEVSPIIKISHKEDATHYIFKITDNGIGIKQEQIHKIFDMFSRLHSTKDYEGQGIGLAFCKKIVEMHHGEIWVESTHGESTTFNFTLQK